MSSLTLEQATDILLERIGSIEESGETEEVELWDAVGRVLAQDIIAMRNQPPFPRSPLDGYAVRSEDIKGASREHPAMLKVIDEVTAGHVSEKCVTKKKAIRIMTGAPIPDGADCIVGQEDTDYGEDIVSVYEEIGAYVNYCYEGEDYKTGDRLLKRNAYLGAVEAGILASLGLTKVTVYRKMRAALITTGDEIILPGEPLAGGKIYDSNLYTLGTRMESWGMELICKERAGDDAELIAGMIDEVVEDADIIVTTGGVSVGKMDIMHDVLKILDCERLFWRIAVKPGMPTLCGQYKGKLIICLSGNPFGATVNLELLVRPLLVKLSGRRNLELVRVPAVSDSAFPKKSGVTRYIRAYYNEGRVRILGKSNASGILSSMCGCNCLIELPAGSDELCIGDKVWVVLI